MVNKHGAAMEKNPPRATEKDFETKKSPPGDSSLGSRTWRSIATYEVMFVCAQKTGEQDWFFLAARLKYLYFSVA